MDASELIKQAVEEVNSSALYETEKKVKALVGSIFETQQKIGILLSHLDALRNELKVLQLPAIKTLEL